MMRSFPSCLTPLGRSALPAYVQDVEVWVPPAIQRKVAMSPSGICWVLGITTALGGTGGERETNLCNRFCFLAEVKVDQRDEVEYHDCAIDYYSHMIVT